MGKVIAIDGPAGSGKGTVAKILSKDLGYLYIDTGAMYRSIAYLALKNNIPIDNKDKIVSLASNTKIEFRGDKTYVNDEDVSDVIRSIEVSKIVSPVSAIVELREILVNEQREMAKNHNVVMEGRDITTVVFPNADYKIYLDASLEERANRRYRENVFKNINVTYDEIFENIQKRDYNDMHKEVGSLIRSNDALYIDSSNLTIEEVVEKIKQIVEV